MILKTAFEKLFKIREKAGKARPGADEGFDAHEKPFLDHLEDLRTTLLKIVGTLAISTILAFIFHVQIFEFVQWPAKMTEVSEGFSLWDKIDFITLAPQEILMLMLSVAFFAAVIVTFPLTVFFLLQFIVPGLRQNEKKMIQPGLGIGFALFLIGAAFAFFLASPIALKFFYQFQVERVSILDPAEAALAKPLADLPLLGVDGKEYRPAGEEAEAPEESDVEPEEKPKSSLSPELKEQVRNYMMETFAVQDGGNLAIRYDDSRDKIVIVQSKGASVTYRIGEYIKFITRLTLVFGIAFQLPVIVTILVKLELLTARVMQSTRSYAWIIIMVASAILTPPDVMTLGLLAGPMIVLYEICIVIAMVMERKRAKKEQAEEEDYRRRMSELYEKAPEDLSEEEKEELHKREIEQYEKEHEHLYLEDSEHKNGDDGNDEDDDDVFHPGPSPEDHDESWHEDHNYWHDGHEDDQYHDGEEKHDEPKKDWPDKEELAGDGMESDHAEEEAIADEADDSSLDEGCEPEAPVIDLNHASKEELLTLKGVGPKLADAIIEHRPFETFDDVEKIPGIGPNKLNKMIDRLLLG